MSGSHTFFVVTHSYVSQETNAFLGMLSLCFVSTMYSFVFEIFISEHNVIHFIANRPRVCSALMVKAIEVTQVRDKSYPTIGRTDFSNVPVLAN